ncbi:Na(+)/citrate cotransporter-like isoform X2 [Rhipicephalus microplus]|uniref:Na(+)/citrate cotransporter-like isoform X2 n=1 Tax=Rhipicephalus microplus TaxID=6941 RepID=UPI003F6BFEFC
MPIIKTMWLRWRFISIFATPMFLVPLAFVIGGKAGWCAFVVIWMAIYWVTEVIPLAITSLMPLVLFPLLGILSSQRVASFYLNDIGIILVCAMMVGVAVETSNLHKRIALKSILAVGTSNRRLLLGLMLVAMFLSMWTPNISAASIMIPIAMAVVDQIKESSTTKCVAVHVQGFEEKRLLEHREITASTVQENIAPRTHDKRTRLLRTTMVLGVSFATSIGGTGTLIGTGPNAVLMGIFDDLFPGSTEITFVTWFLYNAPTMLICTLLTWAYMQWNAREAMRSDADECAEEKVRREITWRYEKLGKISFAEISVSAVIVTMTVGWFAMKPQMFPGWVDALPHGKLVRPSSVVALMALLLFVIPKDPRNPWQSQALLTWDEAVHGVKWGVMLLLGGGMSLSEACKISGLSAMLVSSMKGLNVLPPALTALLSCFATSLFTEITSNTATSSIVLPFVCDLAILLRLHPLYLAMPAAVACSFSFIIPAGTPPNALAYELAKLNIPEIAILLRLHPLYLAMPAAVACSFSFIIPAGTPPNALAYELAKLNIPEIAKPGFFVNLICVFVEVAMIHVLGIPIFGLSKFPEWAEHYRDAATSSTPSQTTLGFFAETKTGAAVNIDNGTNQ